MGGDGENKTGEGGEGCEGLSEEVTAKLETE